MTTLDNINENILIKIDSIEKISNLFIDKLNIYNIEKKINQTIFSKNINIFRIKYNEIIDKINLYEISSIIMLTEYYSIINKNNSNILNKNNNIYNDTIFLLNEKNTFLTESNIAELKNIYYSNFYQYKCYLNISKQKKNTNISINKKRAKEIYKKFNIFLLSNNIYETFDNYIEYTKSLLNIYQTTIIEYNKKLFLRNVEKYIKKILNLITHFNKNKFIYSINEVSYDICNCGNKMIIQSNTSELLCTKCGYIHVLIGSVFEDSQFFNQEGNRYKHGNYDPNRHCKFWIERIQAKETTIIDINHIKKIENCIKKDKIKNLKSISVKQFRMYLKQTNLSKLNDHIPLIKKIITGYIPPQLTHKELHLLFNYFDKATKIYDEVKPDNKKNSLYYPFLIYKILEIIIKDTERKQGLLSSIHLQSYETLILNDIIWSKICQYNNCFEYKPTDKIDIDF